MVFAEVGYLLNQGKDDKGLPGTYKFGSWLDTSDFSAFQFQAKAALGTGSLQPTGTTYGVYEVIDQAVFKYDLSSTQSTTINLFLRAGVAPPSVAEVDFAGVVLPFK